MKTTATKRKTLLRSLLLLPLLAVLIYGFSDKQTKEIVSSIDNLMVVNDLSSGASEKEMAQYNNLAIQYNAINISERKIPLSDLSVLETVYRKMTITQKENALPFPECLPKNKITDNNRAEKPYIKVDVSGTTIFVNDEETTVKKFSNAIDNVTDEWTPADFQLYRLSINIGKVSDVFKEKINQEYRKTNLSKQAKTQSDFLPPAPPVPPSPISFDPGKTMDHIISVAKKGGTFFYNNAEISSDKAIALLKENPNLNVFTKNFESGIPVTTLQEEPLNFDKVNIKIFKLAVDFNTIIVNDKVSSIETFKNDVDAVTKSWTEKDFKQTQPRTSFKNANEEFLNKLDREFKKTHYSEATGGMSIFWPHFKCKPEHLANGDGYPIVTKYETKNLSKDEIIKGLTNVKGKATTYYVNDNRATIEESTQFVNDTKIFTFQIVEWNAKGKKDVYLDNRKGKKLRGNIPPPPPPPPPSAPKSIKQNGPNAPKVLKGEASNIPPPPPSPEAPRVLKGEVSNIPQPPPAPKDSSKESGSLDINGEKYYFTKDANGIRYYDKFGNAVNEKGEKITPDNK